jgi:hypothetical protein
MSTLKQEWVAAKGIASALLRIATSPLVLRTATFFLLFLAILLALIFGGGFPKSLLWKLALPLFILSAGLAFRTLWNRQPEAAQGPQVYDKAKYHYDGDFPKGLPHTQAFTHTGMFVGWLIEHDMIAEDFLEETRGFRERKITGAQVYKAWDGCLTSDALTDEGNAFAKYYYDGADGQGGPYFEDYAAALVGDLPTLYHVEDTWPNYETIKQKIDQRYEEWKRKQKRRVV